MLRVVDCGLEIGDDMCIWEWERLSLNHEVDAEEDRTVLYKER